MLKEELNELNVRRVFGRGMEARAILCGFVDVCEVEKTERTFDADHVEGLMSVWHWSLGKLEVRRGLVKASWVH